MNVERGQRIVVKGVGGAERSLLVWDSDRRTVYVTDDRGFARLQSGDPNAMAVGFPREDIVQSSNERMRDEG